MEGICHEINHQSGNLKWAQKGGICNRKVLIPGLMGVRPGKHTLVNTYGHKFPLWQTVWEEATPPPHITSQTKITMLFHTISPKGSTVKNLCYPAPEVAPCTCPSPFLPFYLLSSSLHFWSSFRKWINTSQHNIWGSNVAMCNVSYFTWCYAACKLRENPCLHNGASVPSEGTCVMKVINIVHPC